MQMRTQLGGATRANGPQPASRCGLDQRWAQEVISASRGRAGEGPSLHPSTSCLRSAHRGLCRESRFPGEPPWSLVPAKGPRRACARAGMGFVSESGARSEAGLLSCLCLPAERPLPPCQARAAQNLEIHVPFCRALFLSAARACARFAGPQNGTLTCRGRGELALQMSRCPSARNVRRINPPPPEHHRRRTLSPKTQGVRLSSLQLRARPICASSPALPFPQKNLGSSRRGQVP